MILRRLTILVAAMATMALSSEALAKEDNLTIVRAFTGWRDAASFKRISEYFDGKENTGNQTVLRTRPEQRAGYYYQLRVRNPGAAQPVKIQLEIITSAEAPPARHAFTTDLPNGDRMLLLGLTGSDWPDATVDPIAWKLELLSADGRVLATEKSYLWEKPAAREP